MQSPEAIDRYFTEQIVGRPFTVDMGPSARVRQWPQRGVLVEWLGGAARLTAIATRTAWADDPVDALIGQPVSIPDLLRWRRRALAALLVAWSATLTGLLWWWWRP